MQKDQKICISCGRPFEKRKKWNDCWDQVKYCSKSCQKNKVPVEYMKKILDLLEVRGKNKSICPSEVLSNDQRKDKAKLERVRQAARLLAKESKIVITQKNKIVDPYSFKGPIRLKLTDNH